MGVDEAGPEPKGLQRGAAPALSIEDHQILNEVRASLFSRPSPTLTVGRYTIGEPLGRGGCGVVFRARDPSLDRDVAIKFVRTPLPSAGTSARTRMRAEARALARLEHPNVVSVFDVGMYDQRDHPGVGALGPDVPGAGLFLTMELVHGVTLREWLTHPRDAEEILALFRQCALGLAAAHEAGLVHRDFKPANVLVTGSGTPKVLDFGLATVAPRTDFNWSDVDTTHAGGEPRKTGKGQGTPWTMAPEQYDGIRCDARTDQYALAFCLHEALFGRTQVSGITALIALKRSGQLPQSSPRSAPRWLTRALSRALDPSPHKRFPTMRAWLLATDPDTARRGRSRLLATGVVASGCVGLLLSVPTTTAPPSITESPATPVGFAPPASLPEPVAPGFAALDRGDWKRAREICRPHLGLGGEVGAAAQLCTAEADGEAGAVDRSAASSERAYWLALDAERPYLAARAAVGAALQHTRGTRRDDARRWIGHAKSTLGRSQADPEALAADLQIVQASIISSERTPEEAVPEYQAAYQTLLQVLGPSHRRTLRADLLAGNALENANQYDAALLQQNRALAGFRSLHGDRPHLSVARALNDRATTLFDVDRLDDAIVDLQEGLSMAEDSGESRHPTAGMLHHNLGYALNLKGRYEEALAHYEDAIEIREEALGPHHLKVLKGMGNQANSLLKLGRLDEAEQLAEATLTRYEERGVHRLMRGVVRILGEIAQARGDTAGEAHARERLAKLDKQLASKGLR
ncbi:MAG: protein kinase domain-containing protein [Nannocystales bacterium]